MKIKKKVRCAIYTRKSTDENLNSDFTTLDAQRESGEAYIKSQLSEGWEVFPARYDDPGFSGGNMDRPALKALLRDAKDGRFDMVVVYKIDRLTRSLKDFTRIVDVLENSGVSFVAVTQQFNTSTSMGRLTLNVLLSFAQFEREIISERTRDKLAASAKKGKWIGGIPVLGYDVDYENTGLLVNEDEARIVRYIFETYLETKSALKTAHAMNDRGYRTKEWTSKIGNRRGGTKFTKCSIARHLKNPIFIGKIKHYSNLYEGLHDAIVDKRVFELTQALLKKNEIQHKSDNKDKHVFFLRGLIRCSCCGSVMTPSFAYSRGRRYEYYRCTKVIQLGKGACEVRVTPAREMERLIIERLVKLSHNKKLIERIIAKPEVDKLDKLPKLTQEISYNKGQLKKIDNVAANLLNAMSAEGSDPHENRFVIKRLNELDEKKRTVEERIEGIKYEMKKLKEQAINATIVQQNFISFSEVFAELVPSEKRELIQLLIKEIRFYGKSSKIKIALRPLPDIGHVIVNHPNSEFDVGSVWLPSADSHCENADKKETIPWWQKFSVFVVKVNKKRYLRIGSLPEKSPKIYESPLIEAYRYRRLIDNDPFIKTQADIARELGITRARVSQVMKLLSLAPKIQETLLTINDPKVIKHFSERRLRQLLSISKPAQQIKKFNRINKSFNIQ